jgi:hypothetical protein
MWCREGVAEHGQPAFGLLGGGLVLDDIPVFGQQTAFHVDDVRSDHVDRQPGAGESAVGDHVVAVGDYHRVLVAQVVRQGLDELEEPVAPAGM